MCRQIIIATCLLLHLNSFAVIKVACVGDSITAGSGVPKELRATHSYPGVLANLLGDEYEVVNLGASGRTLLRNEEKAWVKTSNYVKLQRLKPDIIIMKLGTNDSKMVHWKNKANFEGDLNTFIDEFRLMNPTVKIYLCLPLPAFDKKTKQLSNGESISGTRILNEIIPIIGKVTREQGLPLIDLNTPFISHPEYFPDGVHPNEAGAAALANVVYESIK
jgi:lysophospholipase L1-like esterase